MRQRPMLDFKSGGKKLENRFQVSGVRGQRIAKTAPGSVVSKVSDGRDQVSGGRDQGIARIAPGSVVSPGLRSETWAPGRYIFAMRPEGRVEQGRRK